MLDGNGTGDATAGTPGRAGQGLPDVPATNVKSGEYVAPAGSEERDEPEAPARVLVVDDVELNRSMLSRRLERRGFEVELAEGGKEALNLIRERTYDIVLLDIMMPEVSGYDVLKEVRKHKTPLELPIIMATAKDQGEDVVSAFKLGANDYITKPIDFPVALARIETQLSRKRATEKSERLMVELERHNQFIRKTFGRYLSKEVVENLLASPDGLALGGEKRANHDLDVRSARLQCALGKTRARSSRARKSSRNSPTSECAVPASTASSSRETFTRRS